mgnify:FL=1
MNHTAIRNIHPEAVTISIKGAYDKNGKPITLNQSLISVEEKKLKAIYDATNYARQRQREYPPLEKFAEAYCEKEIGGDSTKWDAYIIKYNLVRSNNPKPKEYK